MLFDTHCHLNFKTFDNQVDAIVKRASDAGVGYIVVPGTDVATSKKAVKIAQDHDSVYAAVAIHPHHIFQMLENKNQEEIEVKIKEIESLLEKPKVVAVGEVGLDRHMYRKTRYQEYKVEEEFIDRQKRFLIMQINLAIKHKKSLILHNREAREDMIPLLSDNWDRRLEGRSVFHCCEPDLELLQFAKEHKMFIGVDGDVVYDVKKQEFIKQVPIDMLVLETDSPFLSPERRFPNEPANIPHIAKFISGIMGVPYDELASKTNDNSKRLFKIEDNL